MLLYNYYNWLIFNRKYITSKNKFENDKLNGFKNLIYNNNVFFKKIILI